MIKDLNCFNSAYVSEMMHIDWHIDKPYPWIDINEMSIAAHIAAELENVRQCCSVSVLVCDDETIRNYNRAKRAIDKATDILSFPTVSYPAGITAGHAAKLLRMEYDDDTKSCFLGDLIISAPRIAAQASAYGNTISRESSYIIVHGLLHLFGYDHIKESDKEIMRKMEEKIMDRCHLRRT